MCPEDIPVFTELVPRKRRKPIPTTYNEWQVRNGRLSEELLAVIVGYLRDDGLPINTICSLIGITDECWYRWAAFGKKYLQEGSDNPVDDIYGKFYEETRRATALWQLTVLRRSIMTDKYNHNWVRDLSVLERRDRANWGRNAIPSTDGTQYDASEKFL